MAISIEPIQIIETIAVLGTVGFFCSLFIEILDRKTDPNRFQSTRVKLGEGRAWIHKIH